MVKWMFMMYKIKGMPTLLFPFSASGYYKFFRLTALELLQTLKINTRSGMFSLTGVKRKLVFRTAKIQKA
jgi:hypothetical protein